MYSIGDQPTNLCPSTYWLSDSVLRSCMHLWIENAWQVVTAFTLGEQHLKLLSCDARFYTGVQQLKKLSSCFSTWIVGTMPRSSMLDDRHATAGCRVQNIFYDQSFSWSSAQDINAKTNPIEHMFSSMLLMVWPQQADSDSAYLDLSRHYSQGDMPLSEVLPPQILR